MKIKDIIYREDAIKALHEEWDGGWMEVTGEWVADNCEAVLNKLPFADRPQGKWLLSDLQSQADNDNGNYAYVCTNCNHTDVHAKTQIVPYCWWCGARMLKGADDE